VTRGFFRPRSVSIPKNPGDYEGKLVKVSGAFRESRNIPLTKGFKLKDETGGIAVLFFAGPSK